MSKQISSDLFKKIAKLSNLSITDTDSRLINQLSQAADYIQILDELDISNTPPTSQVNHKMNVFRQDVVIDKSFSQLQALSQATDTYKGFFKTKATITK